MADGFEYDLDGFDEDAWLYVDDECDLTDELARDKAPNLAILAAMPRSTTTSTIARPTGTGTTSSTAMMHIGTWDRVVRGP
ncbi:unnamed protein product [Zymoseptoria tritici ST99CH_3D1]|nr:unnamed protein product [Zymoseptoria tritici ST99CH_3D1]